MDPIANELYRLYSNPTPYEVFPDVKEFFHRMRGKPRENIKARKITRLEMPIPGPSSYRMR